MLLSTLACLTANAINLQSDYLVVSGGTQPDQNAVSLFDLELPSGQLQNETSVKGMALWLTFGHNPKGQVVAYGVGHSADWSTGFVQQWNIEGAKDWQEAGRLSVGGGGVCHVLLNPRGQYAYVAGYNLGEWNMVDLYGSLEGAKVAKTIKYDACPHTNNTLIAPEPGVAREHETIYGGRFWADGKDPKEMFYIMDVGCDVIHRVGLNPDGSFYKSYPDMKIPCKGPRHMAMHPVYNDVGGIVCEEEDAVILLVMHDPEAQPDILYKLPLSGFANTKTELHHGAEILWHPNGEFLYASQRSGVAGEGRIATYKLEMTGSIFNWKFTRIQKFKPYGDWPRGVAIHPSGEWLAVADKNTQTVQMIEIDHNTGMLKDCTQREGKGYFRTKNCIYPTKVTQPVYVEFYTY